MLTAVPPAISRGPLLWREKQLTAGHGGCSTAGMHKLALPLFIVVTLSTAHATTTAWVLSGGDLTQNWSNTALITTGDDWSGVPSIMGYRGDDAALGIGVDPQTLGSAAFSTVIDVNANQTSPNTFTTGGVSEFEITDPVVALQGSGTADAANLVFYLDSSGMQAITINYNLRDIDGSADNAIQPVALQFRTGGSGDFANVPAGFVADATTGPSLATLVTPVSVTLPASADNQSLLEIRVMTTNAAGSDEWVGIDDILITGTPIPEPSVALTGLAGALLLLRRRR
jgi:hypothetical protein